MEQKRIFSLEELSDFIRSGAPALYTSSKTSMVIPYEFIDEQNLETKLIVDLTALEKSISINEDQLLCISGPVNWSEARSYCLSKGRDIMTSPTEELACVLAGIATSATGERCFGFGTLRDQVLELDYIGADGLTHTLTQKPLRESEIFSKKPSLLSSYIESYKNFQNFKNGPFPRLEKEIDLMVGFEGQLGVVTSAKFKTVSSGERKYIFFKLPLWEQSIEAHLQIFKEVQKHRDTIISCELIDSNSIEYLPEEKCPIDKGYDYIFLELPEEKFDYLYEKLFEKLDKVEQENIFEMPAAKCHQLRMNIPRYVFEENTRKGVVKKGTDVQVKPEQFSLLLEWYREMAQEGLKYNLFGHFGDAHLHFNYMPVKKEEVVKAQDLLQGLYSKVKSINASPFAEHGIGVLKQNFIKPFYQSAQFEMFRYLKETLDPENIFFPDGFMGIKND